MTRAGIVTLPRVLTRNPVAQAVRRDALRRAVTQMSIGLYLRSDDDVLPELLHDVRTMLLVADALGVDVADALAEVESMQVDGNRWRASLAPLVDAAMAAASHAIRTASAADLVAATSRVDTESRRIAATDRGAASLQRKDEP